MLKEMFKSKIIVGFIIVVVGLSYINGQAYEARKDEIEKQKQLDYEECLRTDNKAYCNWKFERGN